MSKIKITPVIYETLKNQYLEALTARREDIIQRIKKGKTQQEIANYWKVNIKIVNRIYKSIERKNDGDTQ